MVTADHNDDLGVFLLYVADHFAHQGYTAVTQVKPITSGL